MAKYTATFDRIGRRHEPPPIEFEAPTDDVDDAAEALYRAVRKAGGIMSREMEVDLDLGAMRAQILVGYGRPGGTAVIERV